MARKTFGCFLKGFSGGKRVVLRRYFRFTMHRCIDMYIYIFSNTCTWTLTFICHVYIYILHMTLYSNIILWYYDMRWLVSYVYPDCINSSHRPLIYQSPPQLQEAHLFWGIIRFPTWRGSNYSQMVYNCWGFPSKLVHCLGRQYDDPSVFGGRKQETKK